MIKKHMSGEILKNLFLVFFYIIIQLIIVINLDRM